MKTITADIKSGNFKHIYLLCGEEPYLINQFKDKLVEAIVPSAQDMNLSVYEGKDISVEEIIDKAETMPFFAERRLIVIEDTGLFKKSAESLAQYMAEVPEATYFVFKDTDIDKRKDLYKAIKKYGYIAEFKKQTGETLVNWVGRKIVADNKKVTRSVVELFLSKAGDDMSFIDSELEKLLCYCMDKDVIEASDVEEICSNKVEGKVFDMVDAIAVKNTKKAMELYFDLIALKEPELRILSLLERHYSILMRLKSMSGKGFDYRSMSEKLGVPEFAVRKYMGQTRAFTYEQLTNAVKAGAQADEDIKTGQLGAAVALEMYITTLMK